MSYPPTCNRCPEKIFVMFEREAWCREHFLELVNDPARAAAKASGEQPHQQPRRRGGMPPGVWYDSAPASVMS